MPEEGILTIESFTTINGHTESTLQVQMRASCIQSNDDKYVRNLSIHFRTCVNALLSQVCFFLLMQVYRKQGS